MTTKPKRKRATEVADALFRTPSTDPPSMRQRELFEASCNEKPRMYRSFEHVVADSMKLIGRWPDLALLAQKHGLKMAGGPNAYARALRELGIPMTPAAEMVYLATRLHFIEGQVLDVTRETDLRVRMVEILTDDDWLCDPLAYIDVESQDGQTDHLHLFQCGLIGPELASLKESARVRLTLGQQTVPNIYESDELSDDQARFAVELCDLHAALTELASQPAIYDANRSIAYASESTGADFHKIFLDRIASGVVDGSIPRELVQPYSSMESIICHLEVFLLDETREIARLEANMATLATIRGSTASPTDVYGVPVEMFWPCLLRAVHFDNMPTASLNASLKVDQVATGSWIALMTMAHTNGLRAESTITVPGIEGTMPFVEALRKHAGASASNVFESLETRDVMEARIVASVGNEQAGDERVAGRRRALGL